jgi:hypothetical protein
VREATEVRRCRTLRHTFLLTDFVHGEIPCLIASLLCSSDAVMYRQTSDSHDIDECWTINSEAALPGGRCETDHGRQSSHQMR